MDYRVPLVTLGDEDGNFFTLCAWSVVLSYGAHPATLLESPTMSNVSLISLLEQKESTVRALSD